MFLVKFVFKQPFFIKKNSHSIELMHSKLKNIEASFVYLLDSKKKQQNLR